MIFNSADPINVILILAATLLLVYLGKETKNSKIPLGVLIVFLGLIIMHAVQFVVLSSTATQDVIKVLSTSLAVDFGLIMIAFLAYLLVDDMEAKVKNTKVVSNRLDWSWKNV